MSFSQVPPDAPSAEAPGRVSAWGALRLVPRSYAAYTLALGFSDLGTGLARLALPWLLFSVTHSAFILSLGAFAQMSSTFIGPLLGIIVDRMDRRMVLVMATLGRSACWAAVAYLGLHPVWTGPGPGPLLWLGSVLVLAFVEHGFGGLSMQASGVLRRVLTPERARMGMSTWQFTVLNIAWYVSPALAGLVIARAGADVALWLTALAGLFLLGPILFLPPVPAGTGGVESHSVAHDLREGARALRREPVLVWLAGFGFFYNGVWAAVAAISVALYRADLHMDAYLVGIVSLLAGTVTTLTGALTPRLERHLSPRALLLGTLGVSGVGMAVMGAAGGWPEAAGGLSLLELPATPWMVYSSLVAQERIPKNVYGRVNSLRTTISMGGMPLFSLAGGALAQVLGIRSGILVLAAITLLAMAVVPMARTPFADLTWPGSGPVPDRAADPSPPAIVEPVPAGRPIS